VAQFGGRKETLRSVPAGYGTRTEGVFSFEEEEEEELADGVGCQSFVYHGRGNLFHYGARRSRSFHGQRRRGSSDVEGKTEEETGLVGESRGDDDVEDEETDPVEGNRSRSGGLSSGSRVQLLGVVDRGVARHRKGRGGTKGSCRIVPFDM